MRRERTLPTPARAPAARAGRSAGRSLAPAASSPPRPLQRAPWSASRPASRPAWPLAWAAALALLGGCGRSLTEDDCRKVGGNLREVWSAEAKKATAAQSAPSDKGALVIKDEGDKLVADWTSECKRDLVGRRVDERELTCLLQAKSIDQVNACGAR